MMSLINIAVRATFAGMFPKFRSARKRSIGVKILILLLAVYVVAALFIAFGAMFYQLCAPLFRAGLGWFYFSFVGIIVFALCFIGSVFAAQAQIFNAKDNDLLLSLPITPFRILLSRVISLLLLDYIFEAFVAVPAGVVWCLLEPVGAVNFFFFLLSFLILPLSAMALSMAFAWLLSLTVSRLRNKNIVTMVVSLLFLFAYFYVYGHITTYMNAMIAHGAQLADAVSRSIFPAYHLGLAVQNASVGSFLLFAVCMLAPFALALLLLSANFIKIATTNRGAAKIKYSEKTLKVSGIRTALVKKELRHFVSNPMYILNASLGGVFMLVFAVYLAVRRGAVLALIHQLIPGQLPLSAASLSAAALCLLAAMDFVSAPSISLEGKNLWIVKSLPVRPCDVLMAKVWMHILVCAGPALLSAVICAVVLAPTPLETLALLITPALISAVIGFLGVAINLRFPRFDWVNELQPIKQGASTLLTMLFSVALIAALAAAYAFLLMPFVSSAAYLLLCDIVFAALVLTFAVYMKRGGSRRFEELNN